MEQNVKKNCTFKNNKKCCLLEMLTAFLVTVIKSSSWNRNCVTCVLSWLSANRHKVLFDCCTACARRTGNKQFMHPNDTKFVRRSDLHMKIYMITSKMQTNMCIVMLHLHDHEEIIH